MFSRAEVFLYIWVVFLKAGGAGVSQMETCAWTEEKHNPGEREWAESEEDGCEGLERDGMSCGGNELQVGLNSLKKLLGKFCSRLWVTELCNGLKTRSKMLLTIQGGEKEPG